jgi:hypothetical protein
MNAKSFSEANDRKLIELIEDAYAFATSFVVKD